MSIPPPGPNGFDLATTDRLLATTRSVRRRLDLERPVEVEVVLDCLRLAVQAPTASNTQRWRFVIVADAAKRARLAELYRDAGMAYLQRAGAESEGQTRRVYESAIYLAEHLHEVPLHVIPCQLGRVDGQTNAEAAAYYGSILPAAWSFMLALRSRGLASSWTTLHLRHEKEAAELLEIPDDVSQVALLPVAWLRGGELRPAARPPVEEVAYLDAWSASCTADQRSASAEGVSGPPNKRP